MQFKVRKLRITTSDGRILLEEEIRAEAADIRDVDSVVQLLRVISSESRYKVIRQIAEKPCCFTELHNTLGYSQKTIAQCLDDLVKMDAIARATEGYALSPVGRIVLRQLREMAEIVKKIRELDNVNMEFEY